MAKKHKLTERQKYMLNENPFILIDPKTDMVVWDKGVEAGKKGKPIEEKYRKNLDFLRAYELGLGIYFGEDRQERYDEVRTLIKRNR